jgi:hypothetical protein
MRLTIYRLLAVAAFVVGCAGTAAADSKCSAVNIEVTNNFHDPATGAKVDIRIVDFAYWDDEDNKWRDEWTDNKRVNFGQTSVWNKNLEYVGGESGVKIKVYYKYDIAGGGFSPDYTTTSTAFKCVDGKTVAISVD